MRNRNCGRKRGFHSSRQPGQIRIRALGEINQSHAAFAHLAHCPHNRGLCAHALFKRRKLRCVDESPRSAEYGEPFVGVVCAQEQAMLGARSKHAVGLARRAGDEVVEHHTGVGGVASETNALKAARASGRVEAGEKSLRSRLLVATGAVDLTCEKKPWNALGFGGRIDLMRPDHVVLDGVTELLNLSVLKAAQTAHERKLHIGRKRCGDAVEIDLVGEERLGLEEHMVRVAGSEANDLVFDRRAVAGTALSFDLPRIHRRAREIFADERVDFGSGRSFAAIGLREMREARGGEVLRRAIAERNGNAVSERGLERIPINRRAGDAGRSAGLQTTELKTKGFQRKTDTACAALAEAAAFVGALAGVHERAHEGAGGEHDGVGGKRARGR